MAENVKVVDGVAMGEEIGKIKEVRSSFNWCANTVCVLYHIRNKLSLYTHLQLDWTSVNLDTPV